MAGGRFGVIAWHAPTVLVQHIPHRTHQPDASPIADVTNGAQAASELFLMGAMSLMLC